MTIMSAQQKEDRLFENIYLSYFPKMKRFAQEYVISEQDAENIVQDMFAELWEKREMFTCQTIRIAYLFTIIKNKCLCWLWDDNYNWAICGTLGKIEKGDEYKFVMFDDEGNRSPYKNCRPVSRDEVTFYEERKDE